MKLSEAKIIVYLSQVAQDFKYASSIAAKLNIDYIYTIRILNSMKARGLIHSSNAGNKVIYILTKLADIKEAKKLLIKEVE